MTDRKKRIIICSTSDFDSDYRLFKASASLKELGFEVVRLGRCHKKHITRPKDDIRLMKLLFTYGFLFYAEMNIRLFLTLLFSRYDIVYSADLDTLAGCRLAASIRRKKVVFDSHEYFTEIPELKNRPLVRNVWMAIEKIFVPGVALGITVCGSIAAIYKEKYGVDFFVVRNAPLTGRLSDTELNDAGAAEFTILYQGAVNVGRGLEAMVEAMQWLPGCRLVIVGDGDITGEIKALVQSMNLQSRVSFEGKKPFSELPQYMKSASLGLVLLENMGLNYYYSLPNRLFDFIQAGLPILASDFPEMLAIVRGYDVGVCVNGLDPQVIAATISSIASDRQQMDRWKKNMAVAARDLTWENEFKSVESMFLSM
jgi:glycosyltransferase involved in cell wall biosynthesis